MSALLWACVGPTTPGPGPASAPVKKTVVPQPPPKAPPFCERYPAPACLKEAEALESKDAKASEQLLGRCAECSDVSPSIFGLLSTLQFERGDGDSARETLRKGVARFEYSVLLWRSLGRLEISTGQAPAGLSALGRAHRLKPRDEALKDEYHYALARYGTEADRAAAEVEPMLLDAIGRHELDDHEGARRVLTRALLRAKGVPQLEAKVHHRTAVIRLAQGQLKDASEHVEKALELEKKPSALRSRVLLLQAELLISSEKLAEAAEAASSAIEITPREPLAHANLAIAKSLMNDMEGAFSALQKAFESGLARRLSKKEFLKIGPAIEKLRAHPGFPQLLRSAWPQSR